MEKREGEIQCEPSVRSDRLGSKESAGIGEACLILANRKGHINMSSLDGLTPCSDICQLSPPDECE